MVMDRFGVINVEASTSQAEQKDVMMVGENNSMACHDLSYTYGGGVHASQGTGKAQLSNLSCQFDRGSRVLIVGANGAGKSTLLSILGGKKMIPRGQCQIYGKEAFHDTELHGEVMYCGDWWRTDFFFNLSIAELLGEKIKEPRCQRLLEILQIELTWRINAVSDGQRRRCQLLECLATEKSVYIMDELTTDLDLYAREGLLNFLRAETEERGATIFYATHIFDCLADWATHVLFFKKGEPYRCSSMADLKEYHELVNAKDRVPLYSLMKRWVFEEYPDAAEPAGDTGPTAPDLGGPVIELTNMTYAYAEGLPPVLKDMTLAVERGARFLVIGANGAFKSTVMSILGGKRMIGRNKASVLQKDAFNDPGLGREVMYMGDWWRTKFFMNLRFSELLSPEVRESYRCKHLAKVLEVDLDWKINSLSDGQRRRCQLLEALSTPKAVYFMDEITSDLDIYAREGILNFLKAESEVRGATILYCTHIFDHLEGWASHLLHLSQGTVVKCCPMSEVEEYTQLLQQKTSCPLYNLVRKWVYDEYDRLIEHKAKAPKIEQSLDGRVPNLGLAGPFMMSSG
jgi:CCR4-NOT complex subunit CAF16